MKIFGSALLALCALALSACSMDSDGKRRPSGFAGLSSLIGNGASTSGETPGSGWDNAPPAEGGGAAPPHDPMRPVSPAHGDPEPVAPRTVVHPATPAPADPFAGGAPPVPPPMDPSPFPPLAEPPLPAPLPGVPAGPAPSPTADEPRLAPLLPGAKAPGASASDPLYFSFLGKEVPDLARDGVWLTPGVSPTLSGLRGQVVYLQFAFQSCPSCGLTTPYLQQWQQSLGPQGLSIVYVNNGLMANKEAAQKAITEDKLLFPYFHDPAGESLRIYGVRAFPTAYVIDRAGKVVWEGTPTANEPRIGELLQSLLLEK